MNNTKAQKQIGYAKACIRVAMENLSMLWVYGNGNKDILRVRQILRNNVWQVFNHLLPNYEDEISHEELENAILDYVLSEDEAWIQSSLTDTSYKSVVCETNADIYKDSSERYENEKAFLEAASDYIKNALDVIYVAGFLPIYTSYGLLSQAGFTVEPGFDSDALLTDEEIIETMLNTFFDDELEELDLGVIFDDDALTQLYEQSNSAIISLATLWIFGKDNEKVIEHFRYNLQNGVWELLHEVKQLEIGVYLDKQNTLDIMRLSKTDDDALRRVLAFAKEETIEINEKMVPNEDRAKDVSGFKKAFEEYTDKLSSVLAEEHSISQQDMLYLLDSISGFENNPNF